MVLLFLNLMLECSIIKKKKAMYIEKKYHRKRNFQNIFISVFTLFAFLMIMPGIVSAQTYSDRQIKIAIQNDFIYHDEINENMIDLKVEDGVVLLSGKEENLFSKNRARELASSIKGVKSVVNEIKVINTVIDDSKLLDHLKDRYIFNDVIDLQELTIEVDDGVVELGGNVDSYREKWMAEKIAAESKGVGKIQNKIEVSHKGHRPDKEIKKDVNNVLNWDIRIDNGMIEAKVKAGKVTLSGTVGSAREKYYAISQVRNIQGVKSVIAPDLNVDKWERDIMMRKDKYVIREDDEISRALQKAFEVNPYIGGNDIQIDVMQGRAAISGNVKTLKAKYEVTSTAKNTIGVKKVTNYLKVKPDNQFNNDQLEAKVVDALFWDPYLLYLEFNIHARFGKIYLNGIVNTPFEEYHAEQVVAQVQGVTKIINNLEVEQQSKLMYYGYAYDKGTMPKSQLVANSTDLEIYEDIQKHFIASPFINLEDIKIMVKKGEATLKGKVESKKERKEATLLALKGGAINVNNEIEISKMKEMPD